MNHIIQIQKNKILFKILTTLRSWFSKIYPWSVSRTHLPDIIESSNFKDVKCPPYSKPQIKWSIQQRYDIAETIKNGFKSKYESFYFWQFKTDSDKYIKAVNPI